VSYPVRPPKTARKIPGELIPLDESGNMNKFYLDVYDMLHLRGVWTKERYGEVMLEGRRCRYWPLCDDNVSEQTKSIARRINGKQTGPCSCKVSSKAAGDRGWDRFKAKLIKWKVPHELIRRDPGGSQLDLVFDKQTRFHVKIWFETFRPESETKREEKARWGRNS